MNLILFSFLAFMNIQGLQLGISKTHLNYVNHFFWNKDMGCRRHVAMKRITGG